MRKLENAFAPVPDHVHERVESALAQLHREEKVRRIRPMTALIAVVILMLALAGAAVAANYAGVLDYLFYRPIESVPENVEGLVQPVGKSWEKAGVTLTVDEAITDGLTLSFTLSAAAREEPYYMAIESVNFAGEEIRCTTIGSEMTSQFIDHPHYATGETRHIGISAPRSRRVEGTAEVEVHIALMQTQRELVLKDLMEDIDEDAMYRAGKAVAWDWDEFWILGDMSSELKIEVGQERGLPDYDPGSPILCAQYVAEMEVVHDVVLRFTVDVPEVAYVANYEPAADSPMRCEVEIAEVTPLTTMVEMWLYPETEEIYDLWFGGSVDFVDADGQQAQFTGYGRGISALMRSETLSDGRKRIFYATSRSGFAEMPEEIILCPFVSAEEMNEEGIYSVEYFMDYAVRLELSEENLKIVQ